MSTETFSDSEKNPLNNVEEWQDYVEDRYRKPSKDSALQENLEKKSAEEYRDYRAEARPCVKEFYRLNHKYQTLEFVQQKKEEWGALNKKEMGIWEAIELLDTLVDDSDPDTDLSQLGHLLQTAEAIRADGHPRWLILTGLIHDLGKILVLWGEPQWAVVGDTFPVGCKFSDKIVFPEFFEANPDFNVPEYMTELGIYKKNCGLDNVHMSWGHDEYLYYVTREYLPDEALYPIRYHSFYAAHREGAYDYLMNDHDREMFKWVKVFNPYDLYSKCDVEPNIEELRPFYKELVSEYFPEKLKW